MKRYNEVSFNSFSSRFAFYIGQVLGAEPEFDRICNCLQKWRISRVVKKLLPKTQIGGSMSFRVEPNNLTWQRLG